MQTQQGSLPPPIAAVAARLQQIEVVDTAPAGDTGQLERLHWRYALIGGCMQVCLCLASVTGSGICQSAGACSPCALQMSSMQVLGSTHAPMNQLAGRLCCQDACIGFQ